MPKKKVISLPKSVLRSKLYEKSLFLEYNFPKTEISKAAKAYYRAYDKLMFLCRDFNVKRQTAEIHLASKDLLEVEAIFIDTLEKNGIYVLE